MPPSKHLGIKDEYAAYCFDEAVYHFGSQLEAELEGVEGKNKGDIERKQERIFRRVMGGERKFRDPAARKGGE